MSVSIIVPSCLEQKVTEVLAQLEKYFPEAQVIISTDRYKKGKGWGIREAMQHTTGTIICFIDGDMEISPLFLHEMILAIQEGRCHIAVGRKKIKKARVSRIIINKCSKWFIKKMFGLTVETQTGIKVFACHALPMWEEDGFVFDIEILYKAQKRGCRIKEFPVDVEMKEKMPVKSIVKFILDCFKLKRRLNE